LATLVLLFYNKKSIKVKNKIGRKNNQKIFKASQKICKKISHFDLSAILATKVVFLVKKHSKKSFFLKLSFLKF
jgi:hypothetical protein